MSRARRTSEAPIWCFLVNPLGTSSEPSDPTVDRNNDSVSGAPAAGMSEERAV
jgi:hypothetical protein